MFTPDLYTFANGLAIGSAYFMAAAGLTILFGVLRMLNFAHGSFLMMGAYLTGTLLQFFPNYGIAEFLLISIMVGIVIGGLGLIVERTIFRRLHGVDEAVALIATFALMLFVDGVVELIWGVQYISVPAPASLQGALFLGPLIMPWYSVVLIIVGVITFLALDFFLHRSWKGKTLQAIAQDRWIMGILGHSPRRLELLAIFLAFFLAGFAGSVLAPNQILTPALGQHTIIQAFAVVVVGGLGSIRGAFLAAILLGLAESFGSVLMPSLSLYLGMILILILRPQGLIPPKLAPRPGRWSFSWLWKGLLPGRRSKASVSPAASISVPAELMGAGTPPLHPLALALCTVFFLSIALWAGGGIVFLASMVLVSTIFAMSWNMLFGFGGIVTFGHAGFFAVGSYLAAYYLKNVPEPHFLPVLFGAALLAALIALPVGIIALRRATGVHLAILTLALAEVLRVLVSYSGILGRDEGISAIPRPWLGIGDFAIHLNSDRAYYVFLCILSLLVILGIWALSYSAYGRTLRTIRQDPERALFLGINVDRVRLSAFMIAAAIASLAGAVAAPLSQIVTPESASIARSTEPMLNTLLGGAGTFWGPAVGAIIFAGIDYATRTMAGLAEFLMGVILLAVVLIAPGGVAALIGSSLKFMPSSKATVGASEAVEKLR